MGSTVIDRLHTEFSDLLEVLDRAGEVSLHSVVDDNERIFALFAFCLE